MSEKNTPVQKEILIMIDGAEDFALRRCKSGFNMHRYVNKKKRLSYEQLERNFSNLVERGLIRKMKHSPFREDLYELTNKGQGIVNRRKKQMRTI